mmetsp:Transcript_12276/g.26479  ORF Transcript_12276/g.26479 Transcript_12276/m.26479 type:complete len:333 (-) Transcript_12276:430-1428(-)
MSHALLVLHCELQQGVDHGVLQQVGLQTQLLQLGVLGIVVVLFRLHSGVGHVGDLHVEPQLCALLLHNVSQLVHAKLLGELVEHAHLAPLGGVVNGNLDAAHGVANVQEAARLSALAVHGQGVAHCRLHHKAVESCSEDAVIVVAVDEEGVGHGLLSAHTIHHTLVQVSGRHLPGLGGKVDVVGVVDLGQVVEAASLLGVGQGVGASVVCDGDEALLDVDVGGAVLAHGAELHEVAVGLDLLDGKQHVDSSHNVVGLGVHGPLAVDHGVGGGALLPEVHHGIGAEVAEGLAKELPVADVTDLQLDVLARHLLPLPDAVVDAGDGGQGVQTQL